MHVEDLLLSMRSGAEQSDAEIEAFIRGVVDGTVSRPQAAAWLAWAYQRGLTDAETLSLTRHMASTGVELDWGAGAPTIDKHSTGGVGDKVSLILAPLWASLGYRVPMISGRGLGHTGGTLDKLEAIPGFRCDLSVEELRAQLDSVGCFISGQTGELAPSDRTLYALRNECQCVDSVPLVTGSILSKKFAEGVERLILDVKVGSGSFNPDLPTAQRLGRLMHSVATGYGLECRVFITEMNRSLGQAAGNAVEVVESVACLKGEGPADLRELVLALAAHPDAERNLDSGAAYDVFERMVAAQGGDVSALADPSRLLGGGTKVLQFEAQRSGYVERADALEIGKAVFNLGAGRRRAEDPVDFGVGVQVLAKPGDKVEKGQPLVTVQHRDGHGLDDALEHLRLAYAISADPVSAPPLIHEVFGA